MRTTPPPNLVFKLMLPIREIRNRRAYFLVPKVLFHSLKKTTRPPFVNKNRFRADIGTQLDYAAPRKGGVNKKKSRA